MKRLFLALISLVLCFSLFAQPELKCEKRWGSPKFRGMPVLRYRLRTNDFPQGERFRLVVKWFNGEEAETFAYVANRRGYLIREDGGLDDPIYALCPLKKGERIAFLMRSEENPSLFAEASVVPFPLSFKTKSGLKLSLELKSQDGDAFCLTGRKFDPNEKLNVKLSFQGKEATYRLTTSNQGKIDFPFVLEMDDRDGGECSMVIQRVDEDIPFSFLAGRAALDLAGGFALEIR